MSRRNYGRQYFNQPQQAPYGNGDLPDMTFASYTQPYLYQDHSYEYYGVPYNPSPNIHTANSYWCGGGLGYDYSTVAAAPSVVTSSFSSTQSSFSPDAPEFVSRQCQQITTEVENASLQPSTKKKKKKKKKKTPSINAEPSNLICSGDEEKSKSVLSNANEKKSSLPKKLTGFQELPEDKKNLGVKSSIKNQSSKDTKVDSLQEYPLRDKKHLELKTPQILPKTKPSKESKSVRFQESTTEDKRCLEVKNPQISTTGESNKGIGSSWPKPFTNITKSQECIKRPLKMSFADKLKSPVPTKSPFLDWRDQRTSAANAPIKFITNITESEEKLINQPSISTSADKALPPPATAEDGFTTVSRKKTKDKKIEKVPEEIAKSLPTKVSVPAEDAKKKLEKERKKLREKQKKKQAREEKLLAEKLAPKGQKITIITPKLMEQFLKSGRNANAFSKPVMKLSDEMFPALGKRGGKGNVSESESEWETTEIEVVQKEPAVPPRNVKRSDPIEFDLMALITKKNTKKKSIQDPTKKGKNRPGIVANVLDRSAPTLSRGKIRNKKRKLSEIRKALLVAKAKKKIVRESQLSAIPSSGSRPHILHSKKFREYCDQMLTDQIDLLARDMLYHLRMFQDRVFKKDPIKARMKKRLVAGLREVTKQVERNRVKIIFLAPDIQRCPETGGLDEAVKRLLDAARRLDLPIVYAMSRRKLGRVLFKKVPVSCCGILNYQATEETWKKLTDAVSLARENYQLKLQELGLAVDLAGKETKTDDENIRNDVDIAAFTVEKKTDQTDALLELMKLSLKDKH